MNLCDSSLGQHRIATVEQEVSVYVFPSRYASDEGLPRPAVIALQRLLEWATRQGLRVVSSDECLFGGEVDVFFCAAANCPLDAYVTPWHDVPLQRVSTPLLHGRLCIQRMMTVCSRGKPPTRAASVNGAIGGRVTRAVGGVWTQAHAPALGSWFHPLNAATQTVPL